MSNNLIIVPVYPPDFLWAIELLDSAPASENIALGFSNQHHADAFHHSFPFKTLISNIPAGADNFVNKKKLDLLKQSYSYHDYVAVIDSETKFLKPVTEHLEDIWNSNCFLANHSIDGSRMVKLVSQLCEFNHNDDLYPWFNCIPIYKSSLLDDFFIWLDANEQALNSNVAFDFILFSLYCRYKLNMPWKILEGHAWHGLVENGDVWQQPEYQHLLDQVVWSTYRKNIESYPNIKMLFHLDRYPII